MARITWDDSFSVSVELLDEQHRALIDIVNRLYDAVQDGKGQEVLGEILDSLIRYTQDHFESEEKLMLQYGYPAHNTHKMMHDKLIADVFEIRDRFRMGEPMLTVNVMSFLEKWLTGHILGMDKKYTGFIKRQDDE